MIHTYSWFNPATSAESDIVEIEGEVYDAPTLLYMLVCGGSGAASRERYRNPACGPPHFEVSISRGTLLATSIPRRQNLGNIGHPRAAHNTLTTFDGRIFAQNTASRDVEESNFTGTQGFAPLLPL